MAAAASQVASNGCSPEHQPTIPGFSPDPSICVIHGVYYLVTSSFHLYPGLPIYRSEDLRSWKLVGHGIHRPDQLSLRHSDTELPTATSATIATGGLWAPTIRHHAGVTYIICTNVVYKQGRTDSSRRNFIIHTTDILSDQWSDPLYFDFDGIDPSLFFDDDGKVYVQVCAHPRGGIWQFEVDINTAQPLTAPTLLWEGWDCRFSEGPHVYKKDGYYYLLVAEGGTFEDHMISIGRSNSIHGPFEPSSSNPLLTAATTDKFLHHTGHGDFFQDIHGEWWTVFLAVRRTGNRFPLGRETFLTRVDWPSGEWPTIREPESFTPLPSKCENDSFVFLRDADLSRFAFSENDGVSIRASPADLSSHKESMGFTGRRQVNLEGSSSVILVTPSATDSENTSLKAGICFYKDEHRFAAVGYDFTKSEIFFEARNRASGYSSEGRVKVGAADRLHLSIDYTRFGWNFQYREDSFKDWIKLGVVDTNQMSGRDFTGPIIGVFAVGHGESEGVEVHFEAVQI